MFIESLLKKTYMHMFRCVISTIYKSIIDPFNLLASGFKVFHKLSIFTWSIKITIYLRIDRLTHTLGFLIYVYKKFLKE